MTHSNGRRSWPLATSVLCASFLTTASANAIEPPAEWRPTSGWVTEFEGQRRRVPITPDAILHTWAEGTFDPSAPFPGYARWRGIEANDDGLLDIPRSGWVLIEFDADEAYDAVLDPGPSSIIFVNGEPRAGDTYSLGHLEHPIRVHAGRNTLLYSLGRGAVRPVIRPASAPVMISKRDRTLPHFRVGDPVDHWCALVVVNASATRLTGATARTMTAGVTTASVPVPAIEPYSCAKVPFLVRGAPPTEGVPYPVRFDVVSDDGTVLASDRIEPQPRERGQWIQRTYLSEVDGSVQYYAMHEALERDDDATPGLVVSLHGAGVQAAGQIPNYRPRDWAHVVATTNRRAFGFDHEDWGRLDMLEVIADVESRFEIDPDRVWLTGHSMGGHGTWINGLVDAQRFAAIGPSSGWASFWTYMGGPRIVDDGGVGSILRRAANVSDTLLVLDNAPMVGVYILHAQNDDNVPVREARAMREVLGAFHTDWAYYERPGAGHWWGAPCLDWPPMMAFLRDHVRPAIAAVDVTIIDPHMPGLVQRGATVLAQHQVRTPSRVRLQRSETDGNVTLRGTTENVARLELDVTTLVGESAGTGFTLELDDMTATMAASDRIVLDHDGTGWQALLDPIEGLRKSERLPAGFKSVFNHRPFLVYATGGTERETAWASAKTRFDAETFRYRGNGRLDVISDTAYLALSEAERAGRNVVLYGCADTNLAWSSVIPDDAPFDVRRGTMRIGSRELSGPEHGIMLCFPAAGHDSMVGIVGGTGLAGLRTTTLMRFFLSGAHFPDWTVCTPAVLESGWEAVSGCGFFDNAWRYDETQSAWASD